MTQESLPLKRRLKRALRLITPPLLTLLARKAITGRYRGLNQLDKKLEQYLDKDQGFFVELGANDGLKQSNSYYFERYRGWRGILVEPTPHLFLQCRDNRSKQTAVFCNACVSFSYPDEYVKIAYADLMSTALGLESDFADPLAQAQHKNPATFTFGAVAVPLQQLLDMAGAPQTIDLLSLDVEGAELEVLKGINHEAYRFRYLCIESRSPEKLKEYLRGAGYRFVALLSHHDYLFSDARGMESR